MTTSSKVCRKCWREKSISEFSVDRKRSDGLYYQCKVCKNEYDRARRADAIQGSRIRSMNRQWHKAHPERSSSISRRKWIKRSFGLTPEEYDTIILSAGKCCICDRVDDLCIDHCHETGEIRGVLCQKCNRGLGHFGDDLSTLESAVVYLTASKRL